MKATRPLRMMGVVCFVVTLCWAGMAGAVEVTSPNGQVGISFEVKDFDGVRACPVYRISYKGKTVVAESRLGLELEEGLLG